MFQPAAIAAARRGAKTLVVEYQQLFFSRLTDHRIRATLTLAQRGKALEVGVIHRHHQFRAQPFGQALGGGVAQGHGFAGNGELVFQPGPGEAEKV